MSDSTPNSSAPRAAAGGNDQLVERSMGAMQIAEGDEGWQRITLDCPMLVAVAKLRTDFDSLARRAGEMEKALKDAQAFIYVMFGVGPDAVIPATVTTPLGIPIKVREIVADIDAALKSAAPATEEGKA